MTKLNSISQHTNKQILLIEDDLEIGELLCEYLAQHQFNVTHKTTVKDGLSAIEGFSEKTDKEFVAVILDVMLPDGNGFDVCKHIRGSQSAYRDIPIIMLTAKGDTMDRIIGIEIGADDYLAKPFEPRELVARINAVLRRSELSHNPVPDTEKLTFGSLELDPNTRTVELNGQACDLTGYQFEILHALACRAGQTTSRDQLMNALKQQDYDVFDRSIDVHISRIRAEIETDSKHPKRIVTKRGIGYIFVAEQD